MVTTDSSSLHTKLPHFWSLLPSVVLLVSAGVTDVDARSNQNLIPFQKWREGPMPRTLYDPTLILLQRLQEKYRTRLPLVKRPWIETRSYGSIAPMNTPTADIESWTSHSQCLNDTIDACDMKSMLTAANAVGLQETPCQLLQEFQVCIAHVTRTCSADPDVNLLKTSLRYLASGFRANGQCADLPLLFQDSTVVEGEPQECAPGPTWECALEFLANLTRKTRTCPALSDFRDCLNERTRICGYAGSRFLLDGVRGLGWTYQKVQLCDNSEESEL